MPTTSVADGSKVYSLPAIGHCMRMINTRVCTNVRPGHTSCLHESASGRLRRASVCNGAFHRSGRTPDGINQPLQSLHIIYTVYSSSVNYRFRTRRRGNVSRTDRAFYGKRRMRSLAVASRPKLSGCIHSIIPHQYMY